MSVPITLSVCAVKRLVRSGDLVVTQCNKAHRKLCVTLMRTQMNTCLRQMSQYFWECIVVLGKIKDHYISYLIQSEMPVDKVMEWLRGSTRTVQCYKIRIRHRLFAALIWQHQCLSLSVCLPGTFGTNCSQLCTCPHGTSCHHISGECGCPPGYTGNGCEQSECSQTLTLAHPAIHSSLRVTLFSVWLQLAFLVPTASTVIRCVSALRGTSCATQGQEGATVLRGTRDPNVIWVKWTLY